MKSPRYLVSDSTFMADPAAHVFNGRLYIYPSHDIESGIKENDNGDHFDMRDYHVLSMDSIDGPVTDHGVILDLKDIQWGGRQLWDSDCACKSGKFYLYFSLKDKNDIFHLGVAVSGNPNQADRVELMRNASVNLIQRVQLLGYPGELKFNQTTNGLTVELPGKKLSDLTCSLRITGANLKPAPVAAAAISPDSKNRLIFTADDAALHGENLKLEEQGGKPDIGFWENGNEWVSWSAQDVKPGKYEVNVVTATLFGDAKFILEIGGQIISVTPPASGGWDKFSITALGTIEIKQAGNLVLKVRAANPAAWQAINLNSVHLIPSVQ